MKNLLFLFTFIFMDVVGCGPRKERDYLEINPNAVILENIKGAVGIINISSNTSWSVDLGKVQWLEVDPQSGKGNEVIKVFAKSTNEDADSRTCTIFIKGEETYDIKVTQLGRSWQ